MTRRDLIHKWLVYALGLLPLWLLDDYILPRYPLFGVTPMLLPVAAAAVAVLEGAYAGAGFGMAACCGSWPTPEALAAWCLGWPWPAWPLGPSPSMP